MDIRVHLNDNEDLTDISYRDRTIYDYIMKSDEEYCDRLIRDDPRTEIRNQLSSLRASAISWYPFEKEAGALVIDDGYGAVVGALCDRVCRVTLLADSPFKAKAAAQRYRSRENLEICSGDIRQLEASDKYDYIILTGILEKAGRGSRETPVYAEYISGLRPFLREEGKILTAVENRYGVRNWCGQKETFTGIPYEGIAGYPSGSSAVSFHKKQLQDIFREAGFPYCKFYYPAPDHYVVKHVYTDEHLPGESETEGMTDGKKDNRAVLLDERVILKDIIANGTFPFFSNSYFIEACRAGKQSDIRYAEVLPCNDGGPEGMESDDGCGRQMYLNRKLLAVKGNSVIGIEDRDSERIAGVMKVQLDLLERLKSVCDRYGLKLYIIYGTLLGAVRHNGIIPGDDDIDVALPREDYNRLLALTGEFRAPYFLQTPANDECFFGGYTKLRNVATTAIVPQNWWVNCCEGIGIDIFPLDHGYGDKRKEKWKEVRVCFYQRMLFAKAYGYFKNFLDMPMLVWKAYKYYGKLFTREQLADKLNKVMSEGSSGEDAPYGIYAHYSPGGRQSMGRKNFRESITMQYEDMLLEAPAGFDELLEQRYGKYYLNYPVFYKGKHRHGFYETDVPYRNYKKRFSGFLKNIPKGKEIVLFGDIDICREYLKRHGKRYRPAYMVFLPTADDELKPQIPDEYGIPVKNTDEMKDTDTSRVCPIICSFDIRKTECRVRSLGWREYYFFLYDRSWILLADPSYAYEIYKKNRNRESDLETNEKYTI